MFQLRIHFVDAPLGQCPGTIQMQHRRHRGAALPDLFIGCAQVARILREIPQDTHDTQKVKLIGIIAFGVSWPVKGEANLKDE